jgi:hypothetical protein
MEFLEPAQDMHIENSRHDVVYNIKRSLVLYYYFECARPI